LAHALLITGPPASGKSRLALERFLSRPDSVLLTPSSTMAEHIQNELARAGAPLRPSRVLTLARFLDRRTALAAVPEPVLHFLIQDALVRLRPPSFAAVASFRGFHRALAALIEEAPRTALHGPFAADLAAVFDHVETNLAARGMALRHARFDAAKTNPASLPAQIVLDGFFSFAPSEVAFLNWLAEHRDVVVTLPHTSAQRETLLALGFSEHGLTTTHRHPRTLAFHASTVGHELEEIARRILEEAARGRPFREMGILLRSRDPYGPALETVLARFKIPARFYFAGRAIDHPAVAFLAGILRAMLEGWNHEALLSALRMPVGGLGATAAGDRFDLDLRAQLPGDGLPLRHVVNAPPILESLAHLDPWRRDRVPPSEWAARFRSLRALLPDAVIGDSISRQDLDILRSTAAALDLFESVVDQTAAACSYLHDDLREIPLAEFWTRCETALSIEPLRSADRRRNVVHVIDVFEARQWELPVVFVCGLVERHFPQYHREDPLLNDAARRRAGLPASADLEHQEKFLFELATTRATEQVILSYAQFDDQGDEAIPSFFAQDFFSQSEPCDVRVRPRPRIAPPLPTGSSIDDAALRDQLAEKHSKLAPTSIESFLQCPFQFFASKTLRLRPRPPAARDRLDVLLQGSILHRVLAERTRLPLLGAAVFDEIFREECFRARVPMTYRTEAVRLELLRSFEVFCEDNRVALGWPSRVEEEFSFALNPLLAIRGRIDRLDVGPRGQALVIDYKYSAGDKIRERVDENTEGHHVQGGLYLAAAEKHFGLDPLGMLFCGLRKEVVWDGWHAAVPGLESIGESSTRARLRELMDGAIAKAGDAFAAIASGRIAPRAADESKCKWCDFRDVCRIETTASHQAAAR
jgi:hypothetical protein